MVSNFKKIFSSGRLLVILMMGFSSGLPLLLIGGTLRLWMKNQGIDIKTIGAFALVGLPYTLKFLWAPAMDRFTLPFLGRRRGWLIVFQVGLALSLMGLALTDATVSIASVAALATLVSFFSASQDIVIDAYRREMLPEEELGLGSSVAIMGYRFGMLTAGSLAIYLSDHISWSHVYFVMAGVVIIAMVTTFLSPEPTVGRIPRTFYEAVVEPFTDYFKRRGAWVILVFILLYKIGDGMASVLLKPYYSAMGYSNEQIGLVAGPMGIWATIVGGLVGGALLLRLKLNRALLLFGILQALSTLAFVALNGQGSPSLWVLGVVIFFETFSGGMGTAAYVAFMAGLTNKRFTATQYALLTSLMGVPMNILGASSGLLQERLGWSGFFIFNTVIAIPGLLLLSQFTNWGRGDTTEAEARSTLTPSNL